MEEWEKKKYITNKDRQKRAHWQQVQEGVQRGKPGSEYTGTRQFELTCKNTGKTKRRRRNTLYGRVQYNPRSGKGGGGTLRAWGELKEK